MRQVRLHGIANCDKVRAARAWLAEHAIQHAFVDWKRTPPTLIEVNQWLATLGGARVLNRAGTTWRQLAPDLQQRANDEASLATLLIAHPTLIKRPLLLVGTELEIGFDAARYTRIFGSTSTAKG